MREKGRGALLGLLISGFIIWGCAIRPMPEYEKNPTLPKVEGTLELPGLYDKVEVYRDKWGVPHIFAQNEQDLFFADGYVQAQDRLWQMVLFRAIATGRLSEIFGNVGIPGESIMGMELTTLAIDRRMRVMGMNFIGEVGEQILKEFQPEVYAQLKAFCDGINAFIDQNIDRLPIEFQILYYKPDHFRPADIISISRFYGSMLTANLDQELVRYVLIKKYGLETALKLMPLHQSPGPTVVPRELLKTKLKKPVPLLKRPGALDIARTIPVESALLLAQTERAIRRVTLSPFPAGSNNWVVSPKITATKTAMMANDPHLVHIEPSLCYLMHLKGAGYDAYGVVFPGQPYIVMGHTRGMSWGATVTFADTQDLFVETIDPKNHPGKYLYKGKWRDFFVRKEVIRIRPGKIQLGKDKHFWKKEITVRATVHGPVINDVVPGLPKDTPPLALRWTGFDFSRNPDVFQIVLSVKNEKDIIERIKELKKKTNLELINVAMMFSTWMKGKSCEDFIEGMKYNELLNMNWVCADAKGNIVYFPGGLVPVRKKGIGIAPVPGESGEYDWSGFIPFWELPYVINPQRGYMATANNQVVEPEWYPYVFGTNYAGGWRAWRIEELLNQLKPITIDDMRRIQNDVYVKQADVFLPLIFQAVEKKKVKDKRILEAVKILKEWNRYATIDSPAPSIFYETIDHLVDRVLSDDFKGKIYKDWIEPNVYHTVRMWIIKGESEFFDDRRTPNKVEDRDDILVGALKDAIKWLTINWGKDMYKWQWGKLHTIKWYHPMGFGPLKDMSIGPFPHPGGEDTVRNAEPMGFGKKKYMCLGGPVMRHIIDFGEPNRALIVIDGSQSGQWLSPHYRDMHTLWYNSEYIFAEKRPEVIKKQAEALLILTP